MISFVHTADTHFGMENYGKIDPKTGLHTRLLDFDLSMKRLVQAAIEAKVDFFLLCGDAYKTAQPSPTQQKLLMDNLFELYKAKIPVIIVVGNHDHPMSFGRAHALDVFSGLPIDGFYVFSKPGKLRLETKNGPVQIVGIPWPTRSNLLTFEEHRYKDCEQIVQAISQKVSQIIKNLAQSLDPRIPSVLAGHLTVASGVFSGSEKRAIIGADPLFMASDLAIEPFNYVALGHLHRHQNLAEHDGPPIVYSGSIEAIDFGEIKDQKGFCLVKIQTKAESGKFLRICEQSFVPLKTRKMIELCVDVGSGLAQSEKLLSEISKNDVGGAIVKVSYNLAPGVVDCVDMSRVQDALKESIHVICVKPIKKELERRSRVATLSCQDPQTLLREYFNAKGLAAERIELLLKKAQELECGLSCEISPDS